MEMRFFRPRPNEADSGQRDAENPHGRRGVEKPLDLRALDIGFQEQIEQRKLASFQAFEKLAEEPTRPDLEESSLHLPFGGSRKDYRPVSSDTVEAARNAMVELYHHARKHGDAPGLLQQEYDGGKRGSIYITPPDPIDRPATLYDTHGQPVGDGQGGKVAGEGLGSVSYILEKPLEPKTDSTWRVVEAPDGGRSLQRTKQLENGQRIHYAADEEEAGKLVAALRSYPLRGA